MPATEPGKERRQDARPGLKVVHQHRIGSAVVERVSELVYVRSKPVALVDWIDIGGVRTPLYVCELDPRKLHAERRGFFRYDGVTTDPRFPRAENQD